MSVETAERRSSRIMSPERKTMLRRTQLHREIALPIITLLVVLAAWQIGCTVGGVPVWLLPTPLAILDAATAVPIESWLNHVLATTRVVIEGFLVAIAVSTPLAVALARSETSRLCLYPILVVIQSTPIVAIAPILVVTLGAGDAPRVLITALITFFPMVVGISTGLSQTPAELIELSRSLGAPERNEYLHIRLPFALPTIFAAARIGITLAVIGAVVGEFVAADRGIGYFIRTSTAYFNIAQAFAALLVLIALSLMLFHCVTVVQRVFFPRSLDRPGRPTAGR